MNIRDNAYNLIDTVNNDELTDILNYCLRTNPSIFAAVVAQNIQDITPFFTEDDKLDMDKNAKPKEEKPVINSRKPIESSLEDRLLPYLEEFEEGFADTINRDVEEGSNGAYEQAFIEGFKNDYNLTDEDIDKLKNAVMDIWKSTAGE